MLVISLRACGLGNGARNGFVHGAKKDGPDFRKGGEKSLPSHFAQENFLRRFNVFPNMILLAIVLAFEVVSIRPHVFHFDPGSESSDTSVLPGGRLTARNVTVRKLIRNAFLVENEQISGAPGWIDSESYDIEAKKSLLESRFQLQYHRETKEATEYALVLARSGFKMKPETTDSKPSMSTNSRPGSVTMRAGTRTPAGGDERSGFGEERTPREREMKAPEGEGAE